MLLSNNACSTPSESETNELENLITTKETLVVQLLPDMCWRCYPSFSLIREAAKSHGRRIIYLVQEMRNVQQSYIKKELGVHFNSDSILFVSNSLLYNSFVSEYDLKPGYVRMYSGASYHLVNLKTNYDSVLVYLRKEKYDFAR